GLRNGCYLLKTGDAWRRGYFGIRELRTLNAYVEIDDPVVRDIDFPVVIEVSVEPPAHSERDVEVDAPVVADVDFPVEIGVPAVSVFHENARGVDSLSRPQRRLRARQVQRLARLRVAEGVEDSAADRGALDARAVPASAVATAGEV